MKSIKFINFVLNVILVIVFYAYMSSDRSSTSLLRSDFINKCVDLHRDKYSYDSTNYVNNFKKVKVECSKHHILFSVNPILLIDKKNRILCPACIKDYKNRVKNCKKF